MTASMRAYGKIIRMNINLKWMNLYHLPANEAFNQDDFRIIGYVFTKQSGGITILMINLDLV